MLNFNNCSEDTRYLLKYYIDSSLQRPGNDFTEVLE